MKESALLKSITDYLQYLENMGRLYFVRNNSGAFVGEYKGKKRFVRFGKKGSSDIIIYLKGGKVIFIEAKTEKGEQTANQIAFERLIKTLGYDYHVVRSFEEFDKIFKEVVR